MAGAAYEAIGSLTDDESFGFSVEIRQPDGTSLPVAGYSFEYELSGCGTVLKLTEANGITVDAVNSVIAIEPDPWLRLRAGQYRHGLRMTALDSQKATQLFDGSITVTEGNFR